MAVMLRMFNRVVHGVRPTCSTPANCSRSLTNPLSGCSARGPIDWVIPVGVHQFDTEIGVATDAAEPDSKVTLNINLDGQPAGYTTLAVGLHKPRAIDLKEAVDGARRLSGFGGPRVSGFSLGILVRL